MRLVTGLSIAALAVTAASSPAFGKGHAQPSSTADQLGQCNASGVVRDADCMAVLTNGAPTLDPTGARNVDARNLLGDGKGVDGRSFSSVRSASGGSERGMKAGSMTTPN